MCSLGIEPTTFVLLTQEVLDTQEVHSSVLLKPCLCLSEHLQFPSPGHIIVDVVGVLAKAVIAMSH